MLLRIAPELIAKIIRYMDTPARARFAQTCRTAMRFLDEETRQLRIVAPPGGAIPAATLCTFIWRFKRLRKLSLDALCYADSAAFRIMCFCIESYAKMHQTLCKVRMCPMILGLHPRAPHDWDALRSTLGSKLVKWRTEGVLLCVRWKATAGEDQLIPVQDTAMHRIYIAMRDLPEVPCVESRPAKRPRIGVSCCGVDPDVGVSEELSGTAWLRRRAKIAQQQYGWYDSASDDDDDGDDDDDSATYDERVDITEDYYGRLVCESVSTCACSRCDLRARLEMPLCSRPQAATCVARNEAHLFMYRPQWPRITQRVCTVISTALELSHAHPMAPVHPVYALLAQACATEFGQ